MFWLLCLVRSYYMNIVMDLNTSLFSEYVKHRTDCDTWVIYFHNMNLTSIRKTFRPYHLAAYYAHGFINYGALNINESPSLARQFSITSTMCPRILIFHRNGYIIYNGSLTNHKALNRRALSVFPDLSQSVDDSWKSSFLSNPAAILFTDRPKTPGLWKGISCHFRNTSVRIGTTRNLQDFLDFGRQSLPQIGLFNGTCEMRYSGKWTMRAMRDAMESVFEEALARSKEPVVFMAYEFMMPHEFAPICLNGRDLCILVVAVNATRAVRLLRRQYSRIGIKWFMGTRRLPYTFMSRGGVWLYLGTKDSFHHVQRVTDLGNDIERALDGSLKWRQRAEFERSGRKEDVGSDITVEHIVED
jgi:hypothetical protein